MRNSVRDCDALLARRSSRCVLPVWEWKAPTSWPSCWWPPLSSRSCAGAGRGGWSFATASKGGHCRVERARSGGIFGGRRGTRPGEGPPGEEW